MIDLSGFSNIFEAFGYLDDLLYDIEHGRCPHLVDDGEFECPRVEGKFCDMVKDDEWPEEFWCDEVVSEYSKYEEWVAWENVCNPDRRQ